MSKGKVDVELSSPIKVGSQEVRAISLREPKLKDHELFDDFPMDPDPSKMSAGKMLRLAKMAAESLGGLTPGEAGDIGLKDGLAIFTAVSVFFGEPPEETGPKA